MKLSPAVRGVWEGLSAAAKLAAVLAAVGGMALGLCRLVVRVGDEQWLPRAEAESTASWSRIYCPRRAMMFREKGCRQDELRDHAGDLRERRGDGAGHGHGKHRRTAVAREQLLHVVSGRAVAPGAVVVDGDRLDGVGPGALEVRPPRRVPLLPAVSRPEGRVGLGTRILEWFGYRLYGGGFSLSTVSGLTLVYLYFQIPLMVLVTLPAIDGLKPSWREASSNLGGTTWTYWRRVGLPVLAPSLLGGFLLLFARGAGAWSLDNRS